MKVLLLAHVTVALFVSILIALGNMPLVAIAVVAYAILVSLNKSDGIADSVLHLAAGAFTAGFTVLAILNFDSGRYFVAAAILACLAASWLWTFLRPQKVSRS